MMQCDLTLLLFFFFFEHIVYTFEAFLLFLDSRYKRDEMRAAGKMADREGLLLDSSQRHRTCLISLCKGFKRHLKVQTYHCTSGVMNLHPLYCFLGVFSYCDPMFLMFVSQDAPSSFKMNV